MTSTINPWLGILGVMAILGALQGGVTGFGVKRGIHPETMRKIVHIVMGLVCAAFPWVFDAIWPVVTLGVTASLWLLATKTIPWLRAKLGEAVNSIDRESYGDVLFCAGVAALWWLAFGSTLLYVIPILILTFADAVAALVGVNFGKQRYEAVQGKKSIEGSGSFFLVTLLCVFIPLKLYTPTGTVEALLIGTIIGLLVMLLEAIAWRGLDNIFIPLGGFILLKTYLLAPMSTLVADLIAVLLIAGFTIAWRKRTTQSPTGVLAAALVGFSAWALGGWRWFTPALIMFVAYNLIYGRTNRSKIWHGSPIYGVLGSTSASLVWVFVTAYWNRSDFYLPYTLAFAAHLACIGVARLTFERNFDFLFEFVRRVLLAWVVFFLPYMAILDFTPASGAEAAMALAGTAIAALLFYPTMSKDEQHYHSGRRWIVQSLIAGGASVLGLVV